MVKAKIDGVYRDILLGHSKQGMDVYCIHVEEDDLIEAMKEYTDWLDGKIETARSQLVDQAVDQK
jgi:hypothetical protein